MSTPLLQQYLSIKQHYSDVLLFFQVGDFYELFYQDAQKAAPFLGIALTKKSGSEAVPLCGVPVHAIDHYILKLVRGGFRVALCNQMTQPMPGRLVERAVSQVFTPGTLTDSKMLPEKSASYLGALFPTADATGLAFLELLTGTLVVTTLSNQEPLLHEHLLDAELGRFAPDELLIPAHKNTLAMHYQKRGYILTLLEEQNDLSDFDLWLNNFNTQTSNFIAQSPSSFGALSLLYYYVQKNQSQALQHINAITFYTPNDFLLIDASSQRNLELTISTDGTTNNTLFSVIDHAATAMGSRTLKKWLLRPLIKQESITTRLDCVSYLVQSLNIRESLLELLKPIGDLERIIGRIALNRAALNDYVHLMSAIDTIPNIVQLLRHDTLFPSLATLSQQQSHITDLAALLYSALNNDSTKEWLIKSGYNAELDRLRFLFEQGAHAIMKLEETEQQKTGINSLKIKYNHTHGYGIEITNPNLDRVPVHYQRLQTLSNRERFTTQELKNLEHDINRARQDSAALEKELFNNVCIYVAQELPLLKKLTQALAQLDALNGLATAAYNNNYVRPQFHASRDIIINAGQHPVVAHHLRHEFIPNDTVLNDQQSLLIITGPNMGGKSTYLRQVALISIMAQMGSFVPARSAQLPLIDKIFTRIGASDHVARGKSTFLVEMEETALICNQATKNSLVILDEVGRGTSTYDGLAIAQAVIEYIYTDVQARCLFATHYHELTHLEQQLPGIVAYHAASSTTHNGNIVLLHKIIKGVAEGSFGIEVAKAAHLPNSVVTRAQQILKSLNTI